MYTVYSMEGCASCVAAVNMLNSNNLPFSVIKIDEDMEAAKFIKAEGHRSMPQIYKDGTLVPGGFQGLVKFLNARS